MLQWPIHTVRQPNPHPKILPLTALWRGAQCSQLAGHPGSHATAGMAPAELVGIHHIPKGGNRSFLVWSARSCGNFPCPLHTPGRVDCQPALPHTHLFPHGLRGFLDHCAARHDHEATPSGEWPWTRIQKDLLWSPAYLASPLHSDFHGHGI